MESHRLVQVMIIGLVISSVVVFAKGAKGSGDHNTSHSQEIHEHRIGGKESRVPDQHASGERPKHVRAKLIQGTKIAPRALGVNRHVMAVPERFTKDGVYLWCDPDGLWTMFWRGREKFTVNATVTIGKPITVKASVKATTLQEAGNKLKITSTSKSRAGIVQFASAGDSIQLNMLINGRVDPNHVYVGSRLSNPKQFPLMLNTRRTHFSKEIQEVKSAQNQESTGAFGTEGDSKLRSKKTPMPAPPSAGGRGYGGNKAGKAKK